MSGGSLSYFYEDLAEHVGDFGDKELDDLVSDLSELFHDREWYLSSDTGPADWDAARAKFKAKWFTEAGRKERIEQYMDDLKDEVLKSFGLSDSFQHTINALNKGIAEQAKEPVKPTVDEFGNAYCICGENVGFIPQNDMTLPKIRTNYCNDCGRKLVWE